MKHVIHIHNELTKENLEIFSGEYDPETMLERINAVSAAVWSADLSFLALMVDDHELEWPSDDMTEAQLISKMAEFYDKEN